MHENNAYKSFVVFPKKTEAPHRVGGGGGRREGREKVVIWCVTKTDFTYS
jgi:hypothetical protein